MRMHFVQVIQLNKTHQFLNILNRIYFILSPIIHEKIVWGNSTNLNQQISINTNSSKYARQIEN